MANESTAYATCTGCSKVHRLHPQMVERQCDCGATVRRPERRRKAPDVVLPHDPYGSFTS